MLSGPAAGDAVREARRLLRDAGLRGAVLVRDLDAQAELGFEAGVLFPATSLVKVPLALATLERMRRGEIDGATPVTVRPDRTPVPGLARFRHPATVAVADLLYLAVAISDNAAADALFALTPPADVTAIVRGLGFTGIDVRHPLGLLARTPTNRLRAEDAHLAHALAIDAGTAGGGHRVPQLDTSRTNAGSARAFVDLLEGLWRPSAVDAGVAAHVRELMGDTLIRQRLAPDFVSDATAWSSKTGTLLNLRHEIGVVEHAGGPALAVAVLTESRVAAVHQPGAEAVMGQAARLLHDALRRAAPG